MNFRALLQTHFGFENFRDGQESVVNALTTHHAALAVFPTGGGKSLCYQLPALLFDGVTLVVSPLIALMKDQVDFLKRCGIAAERLDSSLNADDSRDVLLRMQNGSLKLLYVAPERFNNERFLDGLKRAKIALFAVDEAHCISEWGHNFRPDYLKLADTAREIRAERVLALTATATPAVVADICSAFTIPPEATIVTGFYRHNLSLATTPVTADARDALLLKRLQSRKPGPTIVYVTLQKTAERIAAFLSEHGFTAEAYHAGMESPERTAVQERWMASDCGIVVATIAFGMGIDKANVRYVYHYNLPKSLESYSQEIGRAGRDGAKSIVEMLCCPDDIPTLENFAYGDTPTPESLHGVVDELLHLDAEFALNLYDLSARFDLRPLVLRTVLTYLELAGIIRQGTPFYAGYTVRLLKPLPEILVLFSGEPARFVQQIFEQATKGRSLYKLNPDEVAAVLGAERKRIVRALEVLEERGVIELGMSDVRHRYTRLTDEAHADALTNELTARFERRESQEIVRLQQVLGMVTQSDCQTNALVGYFGEQRQEPCGHCTFCVTGKAQKLPAVSALPPLPAGQNPAELRELRAVHPDALGVPRQFARFLCGLTSPAASRAKLGRHSLFGVWEAYSFANVLAFADQL